MPILPNSDLAIIDEAKLSGYLLNPNHREGWSKGRFLIGIGFGPKRVAILRDALFAHAKESNVFETEATPFGVKYRLDGPIKSQTGQVAQIRSV